LSNHDLELLEGAKPCRPSRWHDHIDEKHFEQSRNGTLWRDEFPPVIPFAAIDPRIMDLAFVFWKNPDNSLLAGPRRLEDTVRERTGIAHHGTKLFSQAFNPDGALTWKDADSQERTRLSSSREPMPRTATLARTESRRTALAALLNEFLLLNHLYVLERDSVPNIRSAQEQC
jgi:hypothetical protein